MEKRKNHYMPITLLDTQLDILEVPNYAIKVSIDQPVNEILSFILDNIKKNKK